MSDNEHKKFQNRNIEMGRKIAGLPANASLDEIVIALANKEEHAEAVELLFGSGREPPLSDDQMGFGVYIRLWIGTYPDMIEKIVNAYHWTSEEVSAKRKKGGFKIHVYPNEIFMIEEPVATELLTILLPQ